MDNEKQNNFRDYTLADYEKDIKDKGLETTWDYILKEVMQEPNQNEVFAVNNFGSIYEYGLACINKTSKKELGKYYTPHDVAIVMASWLKDLSGQNICDVCCGTGNLIIAYLDLIGRDKASGLLKESKVYLYDIDALALKICKYSIGILYGSAYINSINTICCDFLSKEIKLPEKSKVISNPPYFKIQSYEDSWELTENLTKSKEFYSAIMEKILRQSVSSVIITPYSFMGGEKFYNLRREMNNHNGFIVSFDNVPGNIFNGKKHGIFNSNTSNSVRAAITVTIDNKNTGYRISPLIRFKNEERGRILNSALLEKYVGKKRQIVTEKNTSYKKCFPCLEDTLQNWEEKSEKTLSDYISEKPTEYVLCIPNSCRYYTVASCKDLQRTGKYILYFNNSKDRDLIYCFLNSSFNYWHWRIFDGGITYSIGLLERLPIFIDKLDNVTEGKLIQKAHELKVIESEYLVYKKNANQLQENIKFPDRHRNEINTLFLEALGIESCDLSIIHNNFFFTKEEGKNNG